MATAKRFKPKPPSAAAKHADWLNLVDPTGPFLTLPVLRKALPDGTDRTPTELRSELRGRVEQLGRELGHRQEFVRWVLTTLLGFEATVAWGQIVPETCVVALPEHGVLLRPDAAILQPVNHPKAGSSRLLVSVYPATTNLRTHLPNERWAASPIDRMAALCRSVGCQLGLVTDGDMFTLVWANPTGGVGSATWIASVFAEGGEGPLLDSFATILGAKRFFSVAPENQLEALLAESANAQTEVTNQLGLQVRQAVELLVAAISRTDRDRPHTTDSPLLGVEPTTIYQATCTVLMRIVFLLYAEERRLLPLGDHRYDANYSASTLLAQLRERARIETDEALDHTHTAWPRLLALFRTVHGGLSHDMLRIPAYGGGLFDPDRYPFLEGRTGGNWRTQHADPLRIDDRTMLGVFAALQELRFTEAGVQETRRLSFRSLAVEQIGHVYEGLLDHTATPITKVTVGLVGKKVGTEAEVTLDELEHHAARGSDDLAEYLKEHGVPGRIISTLMKPVDDQRRRRLREAAEDAELAERLGPFAAIIRDDLRGLPIVLQPGTFYVTETTTRRDGGIEYTPRSLADEIVLHALEPIVYLPGPAESGDRSTWKLKSSDQILKLRVCDPAAGSGAFLVAATRWLAERLVEAWQTEGNPLIDQLGGHADLAVDDTDDLTLEARRRIAEHCIYGVDRDPMAVEMAKLSLWLTTMAKERPFSFVDHAIRCGDSLLGITSFDQVSHFHIDPTKAARVNPAGDLSAYVARALVARRQLESFTVATLEDAETKRRLLREADEAMSLVKLVADLVIGAALVTAMSGNGSIEDKRAIVGRDLEEAVNGDTALQALLQSQADRWLNQFRPEGSQQRHCLHWPLEFPEVFDGGGRFDGIVGNPPFLGGQRLTARIGEDLREYCVNYIANRRRGSADLVAYFFLRVAQLATGFGLLATNSIGQGDTREVGLDALVDSGWSIHQAVKSVPWPGNATLEIAKVWLRSAGWAGKVTLDDRPTRRITPSLDNESRVAGNPHRLPENASKAFQGSNILGLGFTMTPAEAKALIQKDPRNQAVLFPFLNGEDLNTSPTQQASRWVINFFDWSEERAREYPDCFTIIEQKVKPERAKVNRAARRDRWWRYAEPAPNLYRAIANLDRVLSVALTSKVVQVVFVHQNQIFSHATAVFASNSYVDFGVLSSSFHRTWALKYASSMRNDLRYTPSDVFETFPMPPVSGSIAEHAERVDRHRSLLMVTNNEGLTKTYNRFHSTTDNSAGIRQLRQFHVDLDRAVCGAYGWFGLELDHGFHLTPQGIRFTVSPAVQTELLDRLLEENHLRSRADSPGIAQGVLL
jgi:hypothetical protein